MDLQHPPIFLVGAERSGTTLLRLMLSHHPKISFLSECEYFVDYFNDDGEFPDVEKYCCEIQKDRIFVNSRSEIHPNLSFQELVNSFLIQGKQKPDSPFVGATVHRNFDRLRKLWPDCRFIHIIRDPRDVSSSRIKMGWDHTHWHAVQEWVEVEKMWDKISQSFSSSDFCEVHYEDLIREPEKTLALLCNWIGVEYDTGMLDYINKSSYSKPNAKHVLSWKKKLSECEIQQVESECYELLQKRNYQLSGLPIKEVGSGEQFILNIENKYRKTLFRINRYGLVLYLESIIAKRVPSEAWRKNVREKMWEVDYRFIK